MRQKLSHLKQHYNMPKWIFSIVLFLVGIHSQAQPLVWNLGDQAWTFRKATESTTYRATIPGSIHTDLAKNQLIADPFYANNEASVQWVENETWVYETEVHLNATQLKQEFVYLLFEGLDTYAKVYLNNREILAADNMFRHWEISIKPYAQVGKNALKIVFEPVMARAKLLAQKLPYTLPGDERVFVRKAPYQFGWDWGPRLVSCGIWKNAWLKISSGARLKNIQVIQKELNDQKAELEVVARINKHRSEKNYLLGTLTDDTQVVQGRTIAENDSTIRLSFTVNNPKKWWTKELGAAHLYRLNLLLKNDSCILDSQTQAVGLRNIELIQKPDTVGSSFYFTLNGVPLYIKGANVIPPESFMSKASEKTYEDLLNNVADQGMNMLRVWGGGVYLDDDFYRLCDEKGLLVWQDFMFAGGMYPGDIPFQNTVKQEIKEQIMRLRNHPSLALWCGNNEIEEAWNNWGWQKQYQYSPADSVQIYSDYTHLFKEIIPTILQELDPTRPYHPSSPTTGWGRKESLLQGDLHYWGVWWGMEPFEKYQEKVGRFVSEFGFQSMPEFVSLQKFIPETEQTLFSSSLKSHQKHPTGYETIKTYMERDYRVPERLADFAYVTHLLQANGMKLAIEAQRAAKPYCMGSLYWQLNDCWPVSSWSSVDYYGNRKALHYYTKRAYKPVIIVVQGGPNNTKITLVSDALRSISGQLKIELIHFNGKVLKSHTQTVSIAANGTYTPTAMPSTFLHGTNPTETLLRYRLLENNTLLSEQLQYLVKPKELTLKNPKIKIKKLDERHFQLRSGYLAKDVQLSISGAVPSDNYFDLLPGQKKIITLDTNLNINNTYLKANSLWETKQN